MNNQLDAQGIQIQELSSNIESQGQAIELNRQDIVQLGESIESFENYDDRIEENTNEIKSVNSTVQDLSVTVAENEGKIESLEENNCSLDGLNDLNDRIDKNEADIESLDVAFEEMSEKILNNENVVANLSFEVLNLSDDIEEIFSFFEVYDEEIEVVQKNLTEANTKIENLEENHQELRNDFEILKGDFRSFAIEISQWQINVDDRLNQTETQIQDLNQIISGTTTTELPTTTTRPSSPDKCA